MDTTVKKITEKVLQIKDVFDSELRTTELLMQTELIPLSEVDKQLHVLEGKAAILQEIIDYIQQEFL